MLLCVVNRKLIPMRHRRATINESFGAWEFLYINSGCPVRGEELVHFQFYCEDFHSKNQVPSPTPKIISEDAAVAVSSLICCFMEPLLLGEGKLFLFVQKGFEYRQAALNHLEAHAVADAEISGAAEAVAGNQEQIVLLGLFGESVGIPAGGLDEQVEGAVGLGHFVAHLGQAFIQGPAVAVVGLQVRPQIRTPGDHLLP